MNSKGNKYILDSINWESTAIKSNLNHSFLINLKYNDWNLKYFPNLNYENLISLKSEIKNSFKYKNDYFSINLLNPTNLNFSIPNIGLNLKIKKNELVLKHFQYDEIGSFFFQFKGKKEGLEFSIFEKISQRIYAGYSISSDIHSYCFLLDFNPLKIYLISSLFHFRLISPSGFSIQFENQKNKINLNLILSQLSKFNFSYEYRLNNSIIGFKMKSQNNLKFGYLLNFSNNNYFQFRISNKKIFTQIHNEINNFSSFDFKMILNSNNIPKFGYNLNLDFK